MTTLAKQDQATTAPRTRDVHIIDASNGPLIGQGRLRRLLPFLATATISVVIAVPTTAWIRPVWAVAGLLLIAFAAITSVTFPWNRVPRSGQLAFPYLLLLGTLMTEQATDNGVGSPFITIAVLPLTWLAVYENRAAVVSAITLAGVFLWLAAPDGKAEPPANAFVATAVLLVCFLGVGVTLHELVANVRALALELRADEVALAQKATVLNALPDLVSCYRVADHVITYCNTGWATQYSGPDGDAVGRPLEEFLSSDELDGLHSQLALLGPDNPILVDKAPRVSGDDDRWLEWVDRYLVVDDGPEVISIGRDVTRRRQLEMELIESETRFRDLADRSADVVWRISTEPTPHFDYLSPSTERIIGYPPAYFLADFNRIFDILDAAGVAEIARALNGEQLPDHFDFRFRHANGSIVVGETRSALVPNGLQGVSRDVTELRLLQDEMAALALRDELTGLANRRLFNELFEADLARTQRNNLPLAVAFLDLDGFKTINDLHGHDAGDAVLRETGRRLLQIVRGADTVARLGGDEFVIVYAPNDANSYNLIARIDRSLSEPIWISATTAVVCPASIGVADTTAVGYEAAALLVAADAAMYETKRARSAVSDADLART